jgi:hypothetical protein
MREINDPAAGRSHVVNMIMMPAAIISRALSTPPDAG